MITAIVYTSNAGHTKEYADILGKKTGLPVFTLEKARSELVAGTEILYLGWLMNGKIKGYKKAGTVFRVRAVLGVGMGASGSRLKEIIKINALPDDLPVFVLPGGLDINRLHGIYKLMTNMIRKSTIRTLQQKPNRTPEDDTVLNMMQSGGYLVSEDALKDVLDWYSQSI